MIILVFGYCVMGLIFLVARFFYHVLRKKNLHQNLLHVVRNDVVILYDYIKQTILSYPRIFNFVAVIMVCLVILPMMPIRIEIGYMIEDFFSMTMFFLLVVVFAPQENQYDKGFPVEIFGFIYSIIFMYYSAGSFVFDIFYAIDSLKDGMWIYGFIVTMVSYVICIATISRFMERKLSKQEIIILGMIMLTTLEFIMYYGIGFFGGMKWHGYDPATYEISILNIFGDVTSIINQGIFIASQSEILERSASDIWGYIILNGTDVLTITVVLGYLVQKFMEM